MGKLFPTPKVGPIPTSRRNRQEVPASGGKVVGGGMGSSKASAPSLALPRKTAEAKRSAMLAGDPGTATPAKPLGGRGSFTARSAHDMPACAIRIKCPVRHVSSDVAQVALQHEHFGGV